MIVCAPARLRSVRSPSAAGCHSLRNAPSVERLQAMESDLRSARAAPRSGRCMQPCVVVCMEPCPYCRVHGAMCCRVLCACACTCPFKLLCSPACVHVCTCSYICPSELLCSPVDTAPQLASTQIGRPTRRSVSGRRRQHRTIRSTGRRASQLPKPLARNLTLEPLA